MTEPFSSFVLSYGRCGGTQILTLANLELLMMLVKLHKLNLNNSKDCVPRARLPSPAQLDTLFSGVLEKPVNVTRDCSPAPFPRRLFRRCRRPPECAAGGPG